ncbi:hypothetical protein HPP92_008708 [Vanilla planifolia]|uniref:Fungal lipase-type domain-containing protein n=2 Tax=Vanilla planifolia TaxID=51239 RepID=A0A835RA53_VANPL|nr:hypothetical protein HPP92_008708 [Vanilla planifolia]
MHIGHAAVDALQTLSLASFHGRSGNKLSPLSSCRAASNNKLKVCAPAKRNPILAGPTDTRTHLENLERVLGSYPAPARQDPSPSRRRFLLPSLQLPPLFFRSNEPEEASPRSSALLRRLLSESTPCASPRSSIARRWRELHGSGDWSGLLDPLDPDLRRELLRYGDFVHSAYHAFFHSPDFAFDSPRPVSLPDRSYSITRHLFATASIEPPRWLPDWTSHRSSWIGFVAVCDNDLEIGRMGRRDIIVAIRGTSTVLEWAENLRANLVPLHEGGVGPSNSVPKVECGFRSLYTTSGAAVPSLSAAAVEEVQRLIELYKGEELSVTVTGHSLGAALAVLLAEQLGNCCSEMPPVTVFSFGGPRVGNSAFAERVEGNSGVKVLRVVNAHDLVTRVPAWVAAPPSITSDGRWWDGYEHVGRELRVNSRVSPFLKPDADPACCHDLEAYLHLVDGLGGEGGQFRANAKRSLVRLLSQQRSNVKQLYVSKARALGLDGRAGSGSFASISS